MRNRIDFLDLLFYIGLILMITWFVAKISGNIGTPLWLEYFPFAGAIFEAGVFYMKVDFVWETCKEMKAGIEKVKCEVFGVDKRVTVLESRKRR